MNTLANSEIFFFISSIGFVVLFGFVSILIFYLVKATRSFTHLMEKIGDNVDTVGDAGRDLIDDMRNSTAFRLLFKPRKK